MSIVSVETAVGLCVTVAIAICGFKQMKNVSSLVSEAKGAFSEVNSLLSNNNKLLTNGEPAEATVVAAEETGMRLNDMPMIRLVVDVRRSSGTSYRSDPQVYRAEVKTLVPHLKLPQVQPGSVLMARLDPSDLSKVAVALR